MSHSHSLLGGNSHHREGLVCLYRSSTKVTLPIRNNSSILLSNMNLYIYIFSKQRQTVIRVRVCYVSTGHLLERILSVQYIFRLALSIYLTSFIEVSKYRYTPLIEKNVYYVSQSICWLIIRLDYFPVSRYRFYFI